MKLLVISALVFLGCTSPPADSGFGAEEVTQFFDTMVDRHLEAGYEDPNIQTDDALLANRKIVVTAAINERTAKDIISRLIYLDSVDPSKAIDLYVSTRGGWRDAAFAVIDTIHLINAPVNTYAIGGVYSAGAMILAAGTGERVAASNCLFMVHANLNKPDNSKLDSLEIERTNGFWRAHAELPPDWFPMTGDDSHFLSAEEALEFGIVDRVVPEADNAP